MILALCVIGQSALLDRVRDAVIKHDLPSGYEVSLTGSCHYLGGDGPYSLQFDETGSFRQAMQSPAGETFGFDGKSSWKQDISGAPIRITFETEAEEHALAELLTDDWLSKSATVEQHGDGLRLLVSPERLIVDIRLDPATSLPSSATLASPSGELQVSLSNWHEAGGRLLPFRADLTRVGLIDQFQVAEATIEKSGDFGEPAWKPDDATFDSRATARLECKRAASGHMLVRPKLNGKDLGWFILDSGAEAMVIAPGIAKQLGLSKIGEAPETGVGGSTTTPIWKADSLILGPLTLKNVAMIGLDFRPYEGYFGVPIAGIVGYDVFRRSVLEFTLTPARVAVYDPALYSWHGKEAPLKFDGGNCAVEAKAEGRTGWYRVDTGDDGNITFQYPYVVRQKMLEGRKTIRAAVAGAGGTLDTRSGMISTLEIGGVVLKDVPAMFVTTNKGGFSDIFLAGNLGQGVMARFTLVFDYRNYRLGFHSLDSLGQ